MAQNALFLLKKLGTKILLGLLDGLVHLKNIIVFILTWTVAKPLQWLAKTVLFSFAVKIYKWALFIKIRWWDKIYAPIKVKIIYPLTRRYVTHSVIALITLLSVASSLSARAASLENSEQVGQKSMLYTLSYSGDFESIGYVQETADTNITKATNYLGTDVGNVSPAATFGSDTDFANDLPIASIGDDSTLLNPNLPSIISSNSRTKIVEYAVEDGDTIGTIAEKFSISVNTILWANNLRSTSTIRPGDKLVILPTNGVLHKVKSGDTVATIAKYYSSDASKVLEFNALPDASDIKIGEYLIVPDGKVPPPAPAPRPAVATRNIVNVPSSSSVIPTGGKMFWPNGCSRITQYFGWYHSGLDIACPAGTSIRAADDGVVTRVQYLNSGYGHNVMVDHGGGVVTLYGHMTTIFVKTGDSIERGEEIGLEGSTGRSTGPHLHFEVRISGKLYNPLNYIR